MKAYYLYIFQDTRKSGPYVFKHNGRVFRFKYEPYYVGITKQKRRLSDSRYAGRNRFFKNVTNRIKREGRKPLFFKFTVKSRLHAILFEMFLIKLIGRRDLGEGPLTNLTSGGDGVKELSKKSLRKQVRSRRRNGQPWHSEETKKKIGQGNSNPSLETRRKMSKAKVGKPLPPEHCRKLSLASIGRVHTEETRRKIAFAHIGKKVSPETIEKQIETKRSTGTLWPTKKTRRKMSRSHTGMKHSEKTKDKISAANSYPSKETRRKMSAWQVGKKLSEETKKKISDSLKRRHKLLNEYCDT